MEAPLLRANFAKVEAAYRMSSWGLRNGVVF
jgi:hypothetical protein